MSENCYNKIFENIKSNLVPKFLYDESQLEIKRLKSELEATKEQRKLQGDLADRLQSQYEAHMNRIDILEAEKESLEAEKVKIEAEKKIFEVKFNELSLKLKLKSSQCESLLSSGKTDCKSIMSAETQTVKVEPSEIRIVNVPASSSSRIVAKRTITISADDQRKKAKRKKTRSNSTTQKIRKSTQNKRNTIVSEFFTCEECIDIWGEKIQEDFGGDPDREDAPDPKQSITAFSSFEALKKHVIDVHLDDLDVLYEPFCDEISCLQHGRHAYGWRVCAPHGKNRCSICDLSFKVKKHLDQHVATGHANHDMTNKQFYELYLTYKNSSYFVDKPFICKQH